MLLILIPIAWLSIVAFFVVLCQAAARGDAAMTASPASAHRSGRGPRRGLRLLEGGAAELSSAGSGHLATRPRARAAGAPRRRPGCIAGS
jgi:hypothetical protein